MNKLGKLLDGRDVVVLKWVRKEVGLIEDNSSYAESKIVMIELMWHFVNGKKRKLGYGECVFATDD